MTPAASTHAGHRCNESPTEPELIRSRNCPRWRSGPGDLPQPLWFEESLPWNPWQHRRFGR